MSNHKVIKSTLRQPKIITRTGGDGGINPMATAASICDNGNEWRKQMVNCQWWTDVKHVLLLLMKVVATAAATA